MLYGKGEVSEENEEDMECEESQEGVVRVWRVGAEGRVMMVGKVVCSC